MIADIIKKQIADAMKARDSVRLSTLKLLSSELHNEKIAKQRELGGEEEMAVVRREVKKRRDAIESYDKVGRAERANAERAELAILQEFLPEEMGDEELEKVIDQAINEIKEQDPTSQKAALVASMGKVMAAVKGKVGQSADGARIAAMVRTKLT